MQLNRQRLEKPNKGQKFYNNKKLSAVSIIGSCDIEHYLPSCNSQFPILLTAFFSVVTLCHRTYTENAYDEKV